MCSVRDFLLDSRCEAGHTSTITFRGYTREAVDRLVEILSVTAGTCAWPGDPHAAPCGARASHEVHDVGASREDEGLLRRRVDTAPSMPAVVPPSRPIEVREVPGPRSSYPPPPPSSPLTAGE
jgi:hypothetical protein